MVIGESIKFSLIFFVASFLVFLGVLVLFKPSWVYIINKQTNKSELSWFLIIVYSSIFALVIGTTVLIIKTTKNDTIDHKVVATPSSYAEY